MQCGVRPAGSIVTPDLVDKLTDRHNLVEPGEQSEKHRFGLSGANRKGAIIGYDT